MAKAVKYEKVPAVQRRLAGGRMLVQRLDSDTAVSLSGSAPLIWELLDDGATAQELIDALVERYSDEREEIEVGVRAALDSFDEEALLETSVVKRDPPS